MPHHASTRIHHPLRNRQPSVVAHPSSSIHILAIVHQPPSTLYSFRAYAIVAHRACVGLFVCSGVSGTARTREPHRPVYRSACRRNHCKQKGESKTPQHTAQLSRLRAPAGPAPLVDPYGHRGNPPLRRRALPPLEAQAAKSHGFASKLAAIARCEPARLDVRVARRLGRNTGCRKYALRQPWV